MTHECTCAETIKALAERVAQLEATARDTAQNTVVFDNRGISADTKIFQANTIDNLNLG